MESLSASVAASVEAMTWLKPTDRAAVDLALTYAARIDEALAEGEGQEVTKALYLGPHLLNTLRALGGAPAERKALGAEESVGGKLAQLRSVSKPA
ncbi:MAG: terminase small subunit [Frankiaceae bacterium]